MKDYTIREIEELSLLGIMALYRKGYSLVEIADAKEVSLEYVVEVIDYCCEG